MLLAPALRLNPSPTRPAVIAFVGGGGKSSALFRLATELAASGKRVVTTTTTRMAVEQIVQSPAVVPSGTQQLPLAELSTALAAHNHVMLIGRETIEHTAVPKRAGVVPELVDELVDRAEELNVSAILVEADGSRMLPAKAPAPHEPVVPDSTTLHVPVLGLDAIGLPINAAHLHRPEQIRTLLGVSSAQPDRRLTPSDAARLLLHEQGGSKGRPPAAQTHYLLNKAETPHRRVLARLIAGQLTAHGETALATVLAPAAQMPVVQRYAPTAVIILAAGRSRRMGFPKQLIQVDGTPLVARAAQTALACGAQQVVIVTGANAPAVRDVLGAAQLDDQNRLTVTHNPNWAEGQATSVRAGIGGLSPVINAATFLPVDQPFVPVSLLRRLIRTWEAGAPLAAPTVDGTLRGAPALFDCRFWDALCRLEGDVGGRSVLRKFASQAAGIPIEPALLRDLDRPEDVPPSDADA